MNKRDNRTSVLTLDGGLFFIVLLPFACDFALYSRNPKTENAGRYSEEWGKDLSQVSGYSDYASARETGILDVAII